jgi:hypothetical protein
LKFRRLNRESVSAGKVSGKRRGLRTAVRELRSTAA